VLLTLLLIAVLVTRELLSTATAPHALRWRRLSRTAVLPLALCFAVIVAVQVVLPEPTPSLGAMTRGGIS